MKVLHEQLQTPEMATATRVTHEAKGTEVREVREGRRKKRGSSNFISVCMYSEGGGGGEKRDGKGFIMPRSIICYTFILQL